jgi:NAD(P)-dependent dehydrogenase (short-subunit alcohol dehydrogenase family)
VDASVEGAPGRLDDRIAVITGGGRGIGRATALEMARRGARAVVIADVDATTGEATSAEVEAAGAASAFVRCDIAVEEDVKLLMATAAERFGGIDVLHNNAGLLDTQLAAPDQLRLDLLPTEIWDRIFAVNVRGMWLCMKHAFPYLRESRFPAIVNAASVSSFTAWEGEAAYAPTKGAVMLLTQQAALDFRDFGIRVNCYCPGVVETPMIHAAFEAAPDPAQARRELGGMHLTPEPRLAEPVEVARVVCFLASDDASFVNGAAVRVDSGLLAWRAMR